MKKEWQRTESKVVRPFSDLEGGLSETRFRLFPEGEFKTEERCEVPIGRLAEISPEFRIVFKPEFRENKHPIDQLALIVSLQDVRLHRSKVVLETGLGDIPLTWQVPDSVRQEFSWTTGVRAVVAVALKKDRKQASGQPFLRGHWLDRKTFLIQPKRIPHAFPIVPWTGEEFAQRHLPKDTVYWVEFFTDDLNRGFEDASEAFRIVLRNDVYESLSKIEEGSTGKALSSLFKTEFFVEVLWYGLSNLEAGDDLEKGGMLFAMVERVRRATGADFKKLLGYVNDKDRASLRAHVQSALDLRRPLAVLGQREVA